MVRTGQEKFEGYSCSVLENESLTIWLTRDVGPRILGLSFMGGDNILAMLSDMKTPVQGARDYSLRGGHRLWYAPEIPGTTYIADDHPLKIDPLKNGLKVTQNVDEPTGIQKSWQVVMDENAAMLTINHLLTNLGQDEFELAPWAITQFRTGGMAFMPFQTRLADEYGLQANRHLVLWPYTEINSPHLHLNDRAAAVKSTLKKGALKIGAPNPVGWLAYSIDGTLFVKRADYHKDANYLDRGASSQIYCNKDFIEVETLGPAVQLAPGESVEHQEDWQIYPDGSWPDEIGQIIDLFQN